MNFGAETHIKFNKNVVCLLFTVRHFEVTLWLELKILSNFLPLLLRSFGLNILLFES